MPFLITCIQSRLCATHISRNMTTDTVKLIFPFSPEDFDTSTACALIVVGALTLVGMGFQVTRV